MESGVKALESTQLTSPEKLQTVSVVMGHVRSSAQYSIQPALKQQGIPNEQWMGMIFSLSMQAPTLFPALAEGFSKPDNSQPPPLFDYGLDTLLDGIAVLVDKRAKGNHNRKITETKKKRRSA